MVPCRAGLPLEPYARSPLFLVLTSCTCRSHARPPGGRTYERGVLNNRNNREPLSGGWSNPCIVPLGWRGSTRRYLLCSPDDQQSSPGRLGCDAKALLFHEGDRTLLHCIEPIGQSAPAIDRVGEIVTDVAVDLLHRRPPHEIGINLRAHLREQLPGILIAKARHEAGQQRRI